MMEFWLNCLTPCSSPHPQAVDGSQLQLEVDLLVACRGARTPGADVSAALEAAGLVVDGRVVVGAAFETGDAAVLAGGPVAKFSRWASWESKEGGSSQLLGVCVCMRGWGWGWG